MKLSLKPIEEPSKQVEFLYISGSLKRKDPIEEAIRQLTTFTKFVGIVDENEKLYGGFLTWFYDVSDKLENKFQKDLIKYLSKLYNVKKTKENDNIHFYELRKI